MEPEVTSTDCEFCEIVRGATPARVVWESVCGDDGLLPLTAGSARTHAGHPEGARTRLSYSQGGPRRLVGVIGSPRWSCTDPKSGGSCLARPKAGQHQPLSR